MTHKVIIEHRLLVGLLDLAVAAIHPQTPLKVVLDLIAMIKNSVQDAPEEQQEIVAEPPPVREDGSA